MMSPTTVRPMKSAVKPKIRKPPSTLRCIDPPPELPAPQEPLVLARLVVPELLDRHAPREDDGVHGELVGAEVRVEEVHGEDEARREQRPVPVDDGRHVYG